MKPTMAKLVRLVQIAASVLGLAILCWAGYEGVLYVRTSQRFEVKVRGKRQRSKHMQRWQQRKKMVTAPKANRGN